LKPISDSAKQLHSNISTEFLPLSSVQSKRIAWLGDVTPVAVTSSQTFVLELKVVFVGI
jgi:hypothetical protein